MKERKESEKHRKTYQPSAAKTKYQRKRRDIWQQHQKRNIRSWRGGSGENQRKMAGEISVIASINQNDEENNENQHENNQ